MRYSQVIPRGVLLPDGKTCGDCFWLRVLCHRYGRESTDENCIVYPVAFQSYNPAVFPNLECKELEDLGSDFRCSFDNAIRKQRVIDALQQSNWIQKDAAAILNISPRSMTYWCGVYKITHNRWRNRKNGKLKKA